MKKKYVFSQGLQRSGGYTSENSRNPIAGLMLVMYLLPPGALLAAGVSIIDTGLAQANGMDFSDGLIWVSENMEPEMRVVKYDPATGDSVGALPSPVTGWSTARDVVVVGDIIYQPEDLHGNHHIHKFLKSTGMNLAEIPHPANFPTGIASDGDFIFVVDNESRIIHKRSLSDLSIVATFPLVDVVPPATQAGLTYVKGHLYLAREWWPSFVQKIDPNTGELLETLDLPASLVGIGGLMDLAYDGQRFWFLFRDGRIYRGPAGWGGFGCAESTEIDYKNFTASDCAAPQNSVTAFDQAGLDVYMEDFGLNEGKVRNLNVKFNPTGNVNIVSPCEIKLAGEGGYLDINAERVCMYGRKGVTVAPDASNADGGIVADEILLVSEEGDAGFSQGLTLVAGEIRVQALKEAKIGLDADVSVDGALTLISTGDLSSSNAIIRQGSDVAAGEIWLSASREAILGPSTVVSVVDSLHLISTGQTPLSLAAIKQGAHVTAGSLTQCSDNNALVGKNASVEVVGNYHMNAGGSCWFAVGADITAGSTSGNCFE